MESTESAPKKRKLPPRRDGSSRGASDKEVTTVNASVAGMPFVDLKIKEAKKLAVIQAQQEGCLGAVWGWPPSEVIESTGMANMYRPCQ